MMTISIRPKMTDMAALFQSQSHVDNGLLENWMQINAATKNNLLRIFVGKTISDVTVG